MTKEKKKKKYEKRKKGKTTSTSTKTFGSISDSESYMLHVDEVIYALAGDGAGTELLLCTVANATGDSGGCIF